MKYLYKFYENVLYQRGFWSRLQERIKLQVLDAVTFVFHKVKWTDKGGIRTSLGWK